MSFTAYEKLRRLGIEPTHRPLPRTNMINVISTCRHYPISRKELIPLEEFLQLWPVIREYRSELGSNLQDLYARAEALLFEDRKPYLRLAELAVDDADLDPEWIDFEFELHNWSGIDDLQLPKIDRT